MSVAELHCSPSEPTSLIDHRSIEWSAVQSLSYWMHQRFNYSYPGPIRHLRQRIVAIPADDYGDQQLHCYELHVSESSAEVETSFDPFGNRVFHIYAPEAGNSVLFEMQVVVKRDLRLARVPQVSAATTDVFRQPTLLTVADAAIDAAAQALAKQHADSLELATAINSWVYGAMRYGAGATTVSSTAAEALALGQGLCQDYAHIMIAMCRAIGLAARYISGHMLGEGGSHAWVEVLLPEGKHYNAVAFDPTNHRRVTPAYITVAVGRDYADVSPTSGSFVAPYPGSLQTSKRAGLTEVVYR